MKVLNEKCRITGTELFEILSYLVIKMSASCESDIIFGTVKIRSRMH